MSNLTAHATTHRPVLTRTEVSVLTRRVWSALAQPTVDVTVVGALRDEVAHALRAMDLAGQHAARTIVRHAPDHRAMLRIADAMWIGRNLTSLLARLEEALATLD